MFWASKASFRIKCLMLQAFVKFALTKWSRIANLKAKQFQALDAVTVKYLRWVGI